MINRLLNVASVEDEDIVIDFFAGSGSTAEAVMRHKQAGSHARFVLIQIPEFIDENEAAYKAGYKTISQLCMERVKRAGNFMNTKNPDAEVDVGFRVYKLADSFFPQNFFTPDPEKTEDENLAALKEHLQADRQSTLFEEDNFDDLVTEIALKNGYGLFRSLEKLGDFTQNAVYRLTGNDKSSLLCLDDTLNDETVEALQPYSDQQLILASRALDTTKKWMLQNAFKENLHTV